MGGQRLRAAVAALGATVITLAQARPAPIRLSWAKVSETGTRDSNQDCIGDARHGERACFVVADGAGGHRGGETAAHRVVDAVLVAFCDKPGVGYVDLRDDLTAHLQACLDAAIAAVADAKRIAPALADMSATVALLLIDPATALAAWGHLGDSRIYLLRGGAVRMVSRDHSLAQQLIDAGLAGARGLRELPQRRVLLAAVGAENGIAPAICDAEVILLPGDALLLCSDGLWEWIDEASMLAAIPASAGSEDWLTAMCAMAERASAAATPERRAAGRDNFSAYAIHVHAAEAA